MEKCGVFGPRACPPNDACACRRRPFAGGWPRADNAPPCANDRSPGRWDLSGVRAPPRAHLKQLQRQISVKGRPELAEVCVEGVLHGVHAASGDGGNGRDKKRTRGRGGWIPSSVVIA